MGVNKKSLICFFSNARGLISKMDELRFDAKVINFNVIDIAETWLAEKISQAEIAIDGYLFIYYENRT